MYKKARSHGIDTIFVLIVFGAFAFSVLMVLTLGAGVYRNINDMSRENEDARAALSYVRTKVRNLDNAGAISVSPLGDVPALHIEETIGGSDYKTVIYCYGGWLYEMFSDVSLDFSPADGIRIAKISDLQFEVLESGAIMVASGGLSLFISPRCVAGVALPSGIDAGGGT